MLSGVLRGLSVAAIIACLGVGAASAQTNPRLGWLPELGGSCFEGRNAAGTVVDRQCYQVQFNTVVRAAIDRGAYRGESVLGYNRDRDRLEMYAWGNQGEASIFTPTFDYGAREYVFTGAPDNGVATRSVWLRTPDGFDVVTERQDGRAWVATNTINYRRVGEAPPAFSARANAGITERGAIWIERLANRCYVQVLPTRDRNSVGCFSRQYENALRQSWYVGSPQPTSEAVLFRSGQGMRFFHWDARGGFGVGESRWANDDLVAMTDASETRRTVTSWSPRGFEMRTEQITNTPLREWEVVSVRRYRRQ